MLFSTLLTLAQVVFSYTVHHTGQSLSWAYDLNVTTSVDVNMVIYAYSSNTGTVVYANDTCVIWFVSSLALGQVFDASITSHVINTVAPDASALASTVRINYDTIPDNNVTIGHGRLSASSGTPSDALTVAVPVVSIDLLQTSSPTTFGTDLAVSEVADYLVTVTVPECTTQLSVNISFASGQVQLLDTYIISVGANLDCSAVAQPLSRAVINGTHILDSVTFDFGLCLNSFDNVANEQDKIYLFARAVVLNVPSVVKGTILPAVASLSYSDTILSNKVTTQSVKNSVVVEPNLMLTLPYPGPYFFPTNIVPLQIIVSHSGISNTAAYFVSVTLELSYCLRFASVSPSDLPLSVSTSIGANGNQVISMQFGTLYTSTQFDFTIYALVNTSAPMNSELGANVTVQYDSYNQRPGDPYDGRIEVFTNEFAPFYVSYLDYSQTVASTSISQTLYDNVTVGEEITIQLAATIRGTSDLRMSFSSGKLNLLSPYLLLVSNSIVVGSNIEFLTSVPALVSDSGYDVVVDFGVASNNFTSPSFSAADEIVVTLTYRVLDVNRVYEGLTFLTNSTTTFSLVFTQTGNDSFVVVVPDAGISSVFVTNTTGHPVQSGDLVSYGFSVYAQTRPTNSPAFNMYMFVDLSYFIFSSLEQLTTSIALAQVPYLQNGKVVFNIDQLPPNVTWTVNWTMAVGDTVPINSLFSQSMVLNYTSSPETGLYPGRLYSSSGLVNLTSKDLSFNFSSAGVSLIVGNYFSLPANETLSIGELIDLRSVVTLPRGTVTALDIHVRFNSSVFLVYSTGIYDAHGVDYALSGNNGVQSGVVVYGYSTMVFSNSSSDTGLFEVQTILQVADVQGNINGTRWHTDSFVAYVTQTSSKINSGFTGYIVEPLLSNTFTINNSTGDAGDLFVITHTMLHTSKSTADAFNVVSVIDLPSYFTIISVDYLVNNVSTGLSGVSTPVVQFIHGDELRVVYHAILADNTPPNTYSVLGAYAVYGSADESVSRNRLTSNVTVTFATLSPTLSTALVAPSEAVPTTQANAAGINQVLDMDFTLVLPEGEIQDLVVTASLPIFAGNQAGAVFLSANVTFMGASFNATMPLSVTGTRVLNNTVNRRLVLDESSFVNLIEMDFGTLLNAPDNVVNADDSITVRVAFLVRDVPSVIYGGLLSFNKSHVCNT